MVACFEHLVAAGVLRRRQGAGTFVVGRPSWASRPAASGVATLLLRRVAADQQTIDLSVSAPADLRHLPPVEVAAAWASLDGDGLDPRGLLRLRTEVARHLTEHQQLPTGPEELVITAGAQEALWLLGQVVRPRSGVVVTSCPTYLGLVGAFAGGGREIVTVPADAAGADPAAISRVGRAPGAIAFLMPTGHNPAGTVMPTVRRQSIAAVADAGDVTIVEDLALADLTLDPDLPPPPIAALSIRVVAIGSASKLLWPGLRVGWIRADEPLRAALLARKEGLNLATSAVSQAVAAQLLAAVSPSWLAAHRAALTQRRDYMTGLISNHLPAWRTSSPQAGLSLWVELPVGSAEAFAHAAARHGVTVTAGSAACLDGQHRRNLRLSFAETPDTLALAVERLAAAWEAHAQDLAASP
jgi:DNA-binding transcriptional MocR family regulator